MENSSDIPTQKAYEYLGLLLTQSQEFADAIKNLRDKYDVISEFGKIGFLMDPKNQNLVLSKQAFERMNLLPDPEYEALEKELDDFCSRFFLEKYHDEIRQYIFYDIMPFRQFSYKVSDDTNHMDVRFSMSISRESWDLLWEIVQMYRSIYRKKKRFARGMPNFDNKIALYRAHQEHPEAKIEDLTEFISDPVQRKIIAASEVSTKRKWLKEAAEWIGEL